MNALRFGCLLLSAMFLANDLYAQDSCAPRHPAITAPSPALTISVYVVTDHANERPPSNLTVIQATEPWNGSCKNFATPTFKVNEVEVCTWCASTSGADREVLSRPPAARRSLRRARTRDRFGPPMGDEMERRSRITILGLPLLHVATSRIVDGRYRRGIARGWIAVGDVSFGVLISVGGVAVGGIALGGLALGIVPIAGLAVGIYALGGGAIGVCAAGGAAIAWSAALGGLAIARDVALGGAAIAAHANDDAARAYFDASPFFPYAEFLMRHARWLILLTFLPTIAHLLRRRRR